MSIFLKDYFTLFDIKVTFRPDLDALKRQFYKLSREFHPDHFTLESDEKQEEVMQISGFINTAYKVLSDDNARMKYILELNHLLKSTENEALPQSFLMTMMDINESIFDLQSANDAAALHKVTLDLEKIENELKKEADTWID